MASAVARAYMGVWGFRPQWGSGVKSLLLRDIMSMDILTVNPSTLLMYVCR
jgi:hypothetical protein